MFVVHRVTPGPVPTYKIREWDDTPVKGTFYEADLQKVQLSDDALFRIEKAGLTSTTVGLPVKT